MNRHPAHDLIRFLREADSQLATAHSMLVIGGAAALLGHHAVRPTTDIDFITPISGELEQAFSKARSITGLPIPVSTVGVYDAPYEYEGRLLALDNLGLTRLRIAVPERHDLVLMKIVRGYENDIQIIAEMHAALPLELEVLVHRYQEEMTHVIGPPASLRLSFLLMVDTLFGSDTAGRIQSQLPVLSG